MLLPQVGLGAPGRARVHGNRRLAHFQPGGSNGPGPSLEPRRHLHPYPRGIDMMAVRMIPSSLACECYLHGLHPRQPEWRLELDSPNPMKVVAIGAVSTAGALPCGLFRGRSTCESQSRVQNTPCRMVLALARRRRAECTRPAPLEADLLEFAYSWRSGLYPCCQPSRPLPLSPVTAGLGLMPLSSGCKTQCPFHHSFPFTSIRPSNTPILSLPSLHRV
jgi:hypothetical protein